MFHSGKALIIKEKGIDSMQAIEIRNKFLDFFKRHGHAIIPSAPLVPENDSSVLFTTAGMQPLVPYLLGEKHPMGNRIADYQKCVRTGDIEDVGDNRHLTFFEMLGNWSLGDYFKDESIKMSFELLTKDLGIPVEKLSVSCFAGDDDAPRDNEAASIWEKAGIPSTRIYFFGKKDNWWIAGEEGPCGPDTEIFYDTGKPACSKDCNPSCDCGKYVEIWNNVFMQYNKTKNGYEPLAKPNVDTGMGLERITMVLQGKETPFDTEIFAPTMEKIKELSKAYNVVSARIICDHLRASLMIMVDNVEPSNSEQGYILRRLIRRLVRHLRKLDIGFDSLKEIANILVDSIKNMYPELEPNREKVINSLEKEKNKFVVTLEKGEKEFKKSAQNLTSDLVPAEVAFRLYDTYGFPPEITEELAKEIGKSIDINGFRELFKKHQELSRAGATDKFKGGMADANEKTIYYHTATHLLHKALQIVLGEHAVQSGSNITEERLRFDFKHPQKLTPEEIQKVEQIVNEQIKKDLEVVCEEMSLEDARKSGATGLFENKYGDVVKVYSIGDFSKEICGGPHVARIGKLGTFKIKKEEASSAGVRRIKAVLI